MNKRTNYSPTLFIWTNQWAVDTNNFLKNVGWWFHLKVNREIMVAPQLVILDLLELLPSYCQIASNDLFWKKTITFWTNGNNNILNNSDAENGKIKKKRCFTKIQEDELFLISGKIWIQLSVIKIGKVDLVFMP